MLLWIIFAVLTAAVLAVVLRPAFAAPADQAEAAGSADLAVYKDQLADLDRQSAQGRIEAPEYEALRHEVARRILRLSEPGKAPSPPHAVPTSNSLVPFAVAALFPVLSLGLYLTLGAPSVPSRPFAAAATATSLANASASELIAKVEARLATDPSDGRGWDAIAPVYLRLERFADAANAYERGIKLLGETMPRLIGFAEATVAANDGIVTETARAAYEKIAAANPERFEPKFWLALAKEQDGKKVAAAADYRAMLAAAPADVQWRVMVEQRLAAVTGKAAPPRGPSEADVEAAAAMTESERAAMISGMVESLATRLKANGRDIEGWQRLVSAYMTLKQPEKARAALADARAALAGDTQAAAVLDSLARRLEGNP